MLVKLGYPVPHVRVLDRQGMATHRTGKAGFTDFQQFLGTRPKKDIDFPYLPTCRGDQELGRAVAKEMVHLSWQRFLIDRFHREGILNVARNKHTDKYMTMAAYAFMNLVFASLYEGN